MNNFQEHYQKGQSWSFTGKRVLSRFASTIFFGGLPFLASKAEIWAYFSENFGIITRIKIDKRNPKQHEESSTCLHRGSGFVVFKSPISAQKALQIESPSFEGRLIYMRLAMPKKMKYAREREVIQKRLRYHITGLNKYIDPKIIKKALYQFWPVSEFVYIPMNNKGETSAFVIFSIPKRSESYPRNIFYKNVINGKFMSLEGTEFSVPEYPHLTFTFETSKNVWQIQHSKKKIESWKKEHKYQKDNEKNYMFNMQPTEPQETPQYNNSKKSLRGRFVTREMLSEGNTPYHLFFKKKQTLRWKKKNKRDEKRPLLRDLSDKTRSSELAEDINPRVHSKKARNPMSKAINSYLWTQKMIKESKRLAELGIQIEDKFRNMN